MHYEACTEVHKVKEFCHFYKFHRRDAEPAKFIYKKIFSLRALRLYGELYIWFTLYVFSSNNMSMVVGKVKKGVNSIYANISIFLFFAIFRLLSREAQAG